MELNQARINGSELYSSYGVGITSGLKNMDRPATLKPAQEYDWGDENGKEYFLTDKLQDTDVELDCFMRADTLAAFKAQQLDFDSMLRTPTLKTFESLSTGTTHRIKYNSISDFDFKSLTDGKVVSTFKLNLTILRGATANPVIGSFYFGSLTERPTTAAQVTVLPTATPTSNTLTLVTGLKRVMVVAVPTGVILATANDTTVNEDVKSQYIPVNMTIDGQIRKVYIMENIIAYSTSHEHILTFING